ncbi:histidine phosphatase superfamily [Phlyctochytrium arcticum]|nr:histidine phosphatase superfamily [Phlyctochytrium arcticum]
MPILPATNEDLGHFDHFTALTGFFEQSDSNTDDSHYPMVPPHLGLVDGVTWPEFDRLLREKQASLGDTGLIRVLLLQRHGQGIHNAAEAKYGKKAWDEYYSRLPEYFDAQLTDLGVHQLRENLAKLSLEIGQGLSVPEWIFSSPLTRCLNTTEILWGSITGNQYHPRVLENLREEYGDHTCDHRRTRTELQVRFPHFDFAGLVDDEDTLWKPDERETEQHLDHRIQQALQEIFTAVSAKSSESEESLKSSHNPYIGVVCHGGVIEAVARVTKHRQFHIVPGGLLPIVVVGWRKPQEERL